MSNNIFRRYNWMLYFGGTLVFTALVAISEHRYQPQTMAERFVGYFMLGGDLLTGGKRHPRDFIEWFERKHLPRSD